MPIPNTRAIWRTLQMPDDYQKGNAIVSVEGRERVRVENFKGICSYTTEEVRLAARRNIICVRGKRLQIDCYTKEEIEISGWIDAVAYE
ncbi:MAG: YabP/YqfC family sporulation protein [Lachnospiraceae bacterium]|nr:YabP/YqfC family sporulation protein [Lachnospiraceae bacterium]